MIGLHRVCGLPIKLDETKPKLLFDKALVKVSPDIRTINQMRPVLLNRMIKKPRRLYYMYRGISLLKDKDIIAKNNLRFDITVIRPGKLGDEFIKTFGHYHTGVYPEVYEILSGQALCLLQKVSTHDEQVLLDVILVKAKRGDKIVILPGYGHSLINPSLNRCLVTANWISTKFNSQYDAYRKAGGASYFFYANKKLKKNSYFKKAPKLKIVRPAASIKRFAFYKDKPMYSLVGKIERLDFLNHPKRYNFKGVFREDV